MEKLEKLIAVSRIILAWEYFWRAFSAAFAIICLFLAFSWMGGWIAVPPTWRLAGVSLFILSALAVFFAEARGMAASREAAIARIDKTSNDPNFIASALLDQPANVGQDAMTASLWRLHQRRLEQKIKTITPAAPSPRAHDGDRYALRVAMFLLAAVAFVIAGPDRQARLATAFSWKDFGVATSGARMDAWIEPPAYTRKPHIVLLDATKDEKKIANNMMAPVGSVIVIRGAKAADVDIVLSGGLEAKPENSETAPKKTEMAADRLVLKSNGRLTIGSQNFDLTAIPDQPPEIKLLEQPRANLRGSLTLAYDIQDDYGATSAQAQFSDPEIQGKTIKGRILTPLPPAPLTIPPGPDGNGEAQTTIALADSPWGGVRVLLTLHAKDANSAVGSSAPLAIILPQHIFKKPLARALAEQRRNIIFDPDNRNRVMLALRALMLEPQLFDISASAYLGLWTAAIRLSRARDDAALVEIADYLWAIALYLEDGDLSDSERDLRTAQQELRDALQRNASDEEIAKLTQNLRAAMEKFLQTLAQQQARDSQSADKNASEKSTKILKPQDLKDMIDKMEQAARTGDKADAQKTLDQLQAMLENLQTGKPGPKSEQSQRANKAMSELDQIMRDQNQLRDDTFRESQRSEADAKPADRAESKNLHQRQNALADRLEELRQHFPPLSPEGYNQNKSDQGKSGERTLGEPRAEDGMQDPAAPRDGSANKNAGKSISDSLSEAVDAMRSAEGELSRPDGDADQAITDQGKAIEAMRKGAREMAQRMRGQKAGQKPDQGDGQGEDDENDSNVDGAQQSQNSGRDPLGRPLSSNSRADSNARFDPMRANAALRAQRVLEELRKRLGDVSRPQEELDYLERLIRRY